jgi:hypothetical protein
MIITKPVYNNSDTFLQGFLLSLHQARQLYHTESLQGLGYHATAVMLRTAAVYVYTYHT